MKPFDESKYYLGALCKKGHEYEKTGMSLRCIKSKNRCVCCKRIENKEYTKRYPEKEADRRRKYRKNHPDNRSERRRKNSKKYKETHADYMAAYQIMYNEKRRLIRKNNPEVCLYNAKYNKKYKKKISKTLSDVYIRKALYTQTKGELLKKDIASKLIELKRIQLKAYRASQTYRKGELLCQKNS